MKFFADECIYRNTAEALRKWGHDVVTAQEANFAGRPDDELLVYAVQHGRTMITNDLDFSNIRRYVPKSHYGILVLKIRPAVLGRVHALLQQFLDNTSQDALRGTLVILDRNKYRIRR